MSFLPSCSFFLTLFILTLTLTLPVIEEERKDREKLWKAMESSRDIKNRKFSRFVLPSTLPY